MTAPAAFTEAIAHCQALVADTDAYSFGYIGNIHHWGDDRLWGFFRKGAEVLPEDRMVCAGATGDVDALRNAYRAVRDEIATR